MNGVRLAVALCAVAACSRPSSSANTGREDAGGGPQVLTPPSPPRPALPAPALPKLPPTADGSPTGTQLSMSSSHACLRLTNDSLRCWGDNSWGQLGLGNDTAQKGVVTATISGVVEVATGYGATCVILRDRSLRCFGGNHNGAIAPESKETTFTVPSKVTGIDSVTSVGIDNYAACAVLADGSPRCWGKLDGTKETISRPGAVGSLSGLVQIATTSVQSCAVRADGALFCWGANIGPAPRQSPLQGVTRVVLGGVNGCAIASGNRVACWGQNGSGQLGAGAAEAGAFDKPVTIEGVTATSLAVSDSHVCALDKGAVTCWGAEWANPDFPADCMKQTSNGSGGPRGGGSALQWKFCAKPTPMAAPKSVLAIAAGGSQTCALTVGGEVWCWAPGPNVTGSKLARLEL